MSTREIRYIYLAISPWADIDLTFPCEYRLYSGIIFLCTVYDRCTVQLFQVGGVPEMSNPESDSVTLYLRNRYCTLHVALCSEWDKQWKSRRVVWRNFT